MREVGRTLDTEMFSVVGRDRKFLWDTACLGVGEVDEGMFRGGPKFFSLSQGTSLLPNQLQLRGKQQRGPVHFMLFCCLLFAFQ